jgi:hypothetical protein
LFSQQLPKPIIPLVLLNPDFPDILHVWVHPDPEHRVRVVQVLEDTLRFLRVVFQLKFIHFERPKITLHLLLNCQNLLLLLPIVHRSLDFALEGDVRRGHGLKLFERHLVLLRDDVAAVALNLIDYYVDVACEPPSCRLLHIDVQRV